MWEEHPWYQKQQARIIGLFIVALLVPYAGLLLAAALALAIGLLSGTAWLLVKIFTRHSEHEPDEKQHDEL